MSSDPPLNPQITCLIYRNFHGSFLDDSGTMSSASGSPHTPNSYSNLQYSTANTSTSAINTSAISSSAAGPSTSGPKSDPTHTTGLPTPPRPTQSRGSVQFTPGFPPDSLNPAAASVKPRAASVGQIATKPLFSPPYPPPSSLHPHAEDSDYAPGPHPKRPSLGRSRTSTSSEGHTVGGSTETLRSVGGSREDKNATKRASKACENCRLRRRKCSEQRPCKACVEIGLGASCVFRAKARPNRALPKVVDTSANLNLASLAITPPPDNAILSAITSPHGANVSHAHPIRDIDNAVERWAAESGHPMSLNILDPPSLVTDLANRPLPPLLSPQEETRAVHAFLDSTARYFTFIHPPRLLEMLRQYHMTPPHVPQFFHPPNITSPGGLRPDERALVYAAICLGRFKEIPPDSNATHHHIMVPLHTSPDVAASNLQYGMAGIASLGQAAAAAQARQPIPTPAPAPAPGVASGDDAMMGGFQPSTSILMQGSQQLVPMSIKLREGREDAGYFCRALLELQRWGNASVTAVGAMHCLHLFTLLSGGASEMRDILGRMVWQVRELGIHRLETANTFPAQERVERLFYTTLHEDNWFATLLDAPPFVLGSTYDLALTPSWENESTDGERWIDQHPCVVQLTMFENEFLTQIHTTAELSQAYIFDLETRLSEWMKVFREEQLAVPSWMLHTYANIRFHWLRMMLRAPLLSSPAFRLSSLAVLARSASQILLSYHSFAHTASFLPTWGECRRIVSAAHVIVLAHWEGEFAMLESEFLAGVAVDLIGRLERGCPFVSGCGARYKTMLSLLGIISRKPGTAMAPVDAEIAPEQPAPPPPVPISVPIPEPVDQGYFPLQPPPQPVLQQHSAQPSPQHIQPEHLPIPHAFAPPMQQPQFQTLVPPTSPNRLPLNLSPSLARAHIPAQQSLPQHQYQQHHLPPTIQDDPRYISHPALTVDTHRSSLSVSPSGPIAFDSSLSQGSGPHSAAVSSTSSGSMLDSLPVPAQPHGRHLSPQSAPNPRAYQHPQGQFGSHSPGQASQVGQANSYGQGGQALYQRGPITAPPSGPVSRGGSLNSAARPTPQGGAQPPNQVQMGQAYSEEAPYGWLDPWLEAMLWNGEEAQGGDGAERGGGQMDAPREK